MEDFIWVPGEFSKLLDVVSGFWIPRGFVKNRAGLSRARRPPACACKALIWSRNCPSTLSCFSAVSGVVSREIHPRSLETSMV